MNPKLLNETLKIMLEIEALRKERVELLGTEKRNANGRRTTVKARLSKVNKRLYELTGKEIYNF
jgi:hypothetical protein